MSQLQYTRKNMEIFRGKSYSDVIIDAYKLLLHEGNTVAPRQKETKEFENVLLVIEDPTDRVPLFKHRNANIFALLAETIWTFAGRDDLDFIHNYLERLAQFSENKIVVAGAYGPRMRQWDKGADLFFVYNSLCDGDRIDQLYNVYNILKNDPYSRRAVISIYNPKYDYNNERWDIPCVNWLQFRIRNNKLNLSVVSRSMDAVWGSSVNVFEWTTLLEIMAMWLNVEIGQYTHYIGSFHMYDYHFERAKKMVDNYESRHLAAKLSVDISREFFDEELKIFFKKEEYSRKTGMQDNKYTLKSSWLKYVDTLFAAFNNWNKFKDIQATEKILAQLESSDLLDAARDYLMRQEIQLVNGN